MDILGTARGRWIRKNLPNLKENECQWFSKSTTDYNCVGYAVGDYRWWHYEEREEHFWPDNVERGKFVENYVHALETAGFTQCESGGYEDQHEKVAIYCRGQEFAHVALQVTHEFWGSKLGEYEDIEHKTIEGVSGYGTLCGYLRRDRQDRAPLPSEYLLT